MIAGVSVETDPRVGLLPITRPSASVSVYPRVNLTVGVLDMIRNDSDAGLLFVIAAVIAIGIMLAFFDPDAKHDD